MWFFSPEGFYSATAIPRDPKAGLQIRARVRADLENLLTHFDSADQVLLAGDLTLSIIHTPEADYEFRVLLTHEQWGQYLAWAASQIDYTNFKDEVEDRQGLDRHMVYLRVWSDLYNGLTDIERPRATYPAANCSLWDEYEDEWQGPLNPNWEEPTDEELGAIVAFESRSISRSAKKRARRKANKRAKSAKAE